MKKQLIGGLVGGLIFFIWQFLSWGMLELHYPHMQHTPAQDKALEGLISANLEEGTYFMPSVPKGSSQETRDALMKEASGKPWAIVSYHKSFSDDFTMNLVRGFILDFLLAFFLCYILMGCRELSMGRAVTTSLMIGLIGYMVFPYLNSVWFSGNSIPDLIDAIVPFGLTGLFLGWFLNRN